ncbi:MAG: 4'-phosphopantetheinyl transferase superfamily protein [Muribaculaceae bacterium]|nr:4'-phosphopantetheinyl transferase superfamily protein [Muribaculaceae bacterium]
MTNPSNPHTSAAPEVRIIDASRPDAAPFNPADGVIAIYVLPLEASAATPRRQAELAAERAILERAFPCGPAPEISHRDDGSPSLCGADAEISVSHDRSRAAIALAPAGMEIGLDIESADRTAQLEKVAEIFLDERERRFCLPPSGGAFSILHPVSTGERFCYLVQAWVTKEALYKLARRPGWELRQIPLPYPMPLPGSAAASPWAPAGNGSFLTSYFRFREPDAMMCVAVKGNFSAAD